MRQMILNSRRALLLACLTALAGCTLARADEAPDAADEIRAALHALQLAEVTADPEGAQLRKIEEGYRQLLKSHPDSTEVRNAFASFQFDHGAPDEAMQLWRQTLEAEPDHAEAAFQLGHANLQQGHVPTALDLLRRAASSPASSAFHVYSYANALYLFRREAGADTPEAALEEALAQFSRASKLDPANLEYARGYAETFFALKQPDWSEALMAWQHVIELTPETYPSRNFHLLQATRAALAAKEPQTAGELLDLIPSNATSPAAKKLRKKINQALAGEKL